jgi:putative flippase GtrA
METPKHHQHGHHEHAKHTTQIKSGGEFKLALSATLHCLLGCGLGEVLGMIISVWLGLSMTNSMVLAVILGFVFGLLLGVVPLLKRKFTFRDALKTVILAEGLSIVVMETFEVLVQVKIPGVMEAGLTEGIFWLGMGAGLVAGFIAALPVNYIMIKRGVRHQH